jgi:hypothetical protein
LDGIKCFARASDEIGLELNTVEEEKFGWNKTQ